MTTISFIGARDGEEGDEGDRDSWTTPLWLAEALGEVWLDPCSNPWSKIRSTKTFRFDCGQDALKLARFVPRNPPGVVFINPPYSRGMVLQFVRAYSHTRFCFLLRHDVSTGWFRELYAATSLLCTPWQRVNFDAPPGVPHVSHNNPYPHSLFYRDEVDANDAIRRLCAVLRPVKGSVP